MIWGVNQPRQILNNAQRYFLLRTHAIAGRQFKGRLLRNLRLRRAFYAPTRGNEKVLDPQALGILQLRTMENALIVFHLAIFGARDLHSFAHEAFPFTAEKTGVGMEKSGSACVPRCFALREFNVMLTGGDLFALQIFQHLFKFFAAVEFKGVTFEIFTHAH
jgi:hypothetical protein